MLALTDRDAVTAALTNSDLDPDLRTLIGLRSWQIDTDRDRPLREVVEFIVVEPGDSPEAITEELGSAITWEHSQHQFFDWMEDHGTWFEFAYVLTDEFGVLMFVKDDPDVEPCVRAMCLAHSGRLASRQ